MKTMLLGLLALTLGAASPRLMDAQATAGPRLRGVSVGAGFDRFVYEGVGLTAFTYRRSDLRPSSVGTELSVSLFPQALFARVLLLAPDIGAAYNLSLPRSTLLIKAGASSLVGLGGGVAFLPGAHLGAAMILRIDDRTGIRIDAARHYYMATGETEAVWSFGLGLASLPLQAP